MNINVSMKTILMLIGSTECGKTAFAKEVLIPQLKKETEDKRFRTNVQYLSSDAIRQDILGYDYDKYDATMMECSEQAFDILFTKLKNVTSFPVNADFVIVDTTGLSEMFRDEIMKIAKENHYNVDAVIFDYKNAQDYYSSSRSKKLIAQHTKRLRRDVLPTIRKGKYHEVHRVKAKDFYDETTDSANKDYIVSIVDYDEYVSHVLPTEYEYVIIGDIHEQTADLGNLIVAQGFTIEDGIMKTETALNKRFVLVGDFIDKGGDTEGIVEFLTKNREWFYIVKGNHENFIVKCLRGEIKESSVKKEILDTYFTSLKILQGNEELKDKFYELVDSSKDFYQYIGIDKPSFYVTHSPCQNKYIGKLDAYSRRQQRKFTTLHDEPLEEQLSFLKEEAVGNHPFHVFGHVATKREYRIKNKIGIDTGCSQGNKLTSVDFVRARPFFKSVASSSEKKDVLPEIFAYKKSIKIDELEEQERKRLRYILKNKVNFISGTMSPADKDLENEELESLTKGLEYFKKSGVNEVVLQPKYMGSRCNVYLSQNLDECYAVSRNGYKINRIDLTDVFKVLQEQYKSYMSENNINLLLLDGELLPWMVLGEGLINQEFEVVSKSIESELDLLKKNGFEESFEQLKTKYKESNFNELEVRATKKEMNEKFGHATYNTFKNVKEFLKTYYPLKKHEEALKVFQEQLTIYGQEEDVRFSAFSILKIVSNGEEFVPNMKSSEMFSLVSNDEFLVLNLEDEDSYEKAQIFFDKLTINKKMEGVVIKPETIASGVAPYLKVRNPSYLTIVYGYDYQFPHKKSRLLKQKNINRKLRTSIAEYHLGQEMLSFEQNKINPNNTKYLQVVANMLFQTQVEKEIDPRL